MPTPRRIEPGPGQESVWDYPRPPIVVPTTSHVRVEHAGRVIADSTAAMRVLETSQAPAFYFPPTDVDLDLLRPSRTTTWCEWKGTATYADVVVTSSIAPDAAWRYERPAPRFADIAGFWAFYPQRVDACWVDGEQVVANAGAFYGGWITSAVVGPFKGAAGSLGW